MKRSEMKQLIKNVLENCNIKKANIDFMSGCLSEGDFGTYSEGFGITIKADKDKAFYLKCELEKYLEENCAEAVNLYYGEQTASSDRNHDLEEESYNYSHVIIILSYGHRFEK